MGIRKKLFFIIVVGIFISLSGFSTAFANDTVEIQALTDLALPEATPMSKPAAQVSGKPAGDTSAVVSFGDSNLASALAEKAGCSVGELTVDTLKGFSGTLDLSNKDISELDGIEYLVNVEYLILNKNPIYSRTELGRVGTLTNLQGLEIAALSISDIPSSICSMTWLKYLNIEANRLETLPSSFTTLNLDCLSCNYCFFDISSSSTTVERIKGAASTANYQYQLPRLENFYVTCEEMGVAVMHWDAMPDIQFANGVKAVIKRYSVCEPRAGESRGSWKDSVSSSGNSYSFSGLDGTVSYSFDASVDYHIKSTSYDGKYIKNYQKVLFVPKPQPTPTPMPTDTPAPTLTEEPTPEVTSTPIAEADSSQEPQITYTPSPSATEQNTSVSNNSDNFMRKLTILVIIVIFLIISLLLVLVIRTVRQNY